MFDFDVVTGPMPDTRAARPEKPKEQPRDRAGGGTGDAPRRETAPGETPRPSRL